LRFKEHYKTFTSVIFVPPDLVPYYIEALNVMNEYLMTKHTMISASQKAFQNYIRLEMHAHLKHEFYEPHLSIVHLRHEAWYTLNPELKTIVIT
jgi:Ethanolamine utilization protein EutJ (predicted chaperonin)